MSRYILTIITCLFFTNLSAQGSLDVSVGSSYWIKKEKIEDFISQSIENSKNKSSINYNDTVGMVQINLLSLNTRSVGNSVEFLTDKNNVLLYFPNKEEKFFVCDSETGNFHPLVNTSLLSNHILLDFPLMAMIDYGARNIFLLNILPSEISNNETFLYCIFDHNKTILLDEKFRVFNGIDQLLDYQFGSILNFIDIYSQRVKMMEVLKQQGKQFSE